MSARCAGATGMAPPLCTRPTPSCTVLWCAQLWNRKVDTKCLMAWNDNLVVLSFRGTASMRNVLADVKVPLAGRAHA